MAKRCEEKIRYGTAAGAKWTLWGIWVDRYLRGAAAAAASGARTRARIATGGTSRRSPSGVRRRVDGLAVLPTDVVNAADGWPVAEAAVGPPAVVVANER